jgi:hypothetical protein
LIKYVSYHNRNPIYVACGRQLAESLQSVGIDGHVEQIDNNDWDFARACAFKPWFLYGAMLLYSNYPALVYLDSDSVVMEYPALFEQIPAEFDIGVHFRDEKELLASTIYLKNTPKIQEFVLEWAGRSQEDLKTWEQKHLQAMLNERPDITVYQLPPAYCQIFDLMAGVGGPPVIQQRQASRLSRGLNLDHNPIIERQA